MAQGTEGNAGEVKPTLLAVYGGEVEEEGMFGAAVCDDEDPPTRAEYYDFNLDDYSCIGCAIDALEEHTSWSPDLSTFKPGSSWNPWWDLTKEVRRQFEEWLRDPITEEEGWEPPDVATPSSAVERIIAKLPPDVVKKLGLEIVECGGPASGEVHKAVIGVSAKVFDAVLVAHKLPYRVGKIYRKEQGEPEPR